MPNPGYFTKITISSAGHQGVGFKKPIVVGFKKPTEVGFKKHNPDQRQLVNAFLE